MARSASSAMPTWSHAADYAHVFGYANRHDGPIADEDVAELVGARIADGCAEVDYTQMKGKLYYFVSPF